MYNCYDKYWHPIEMFVISIDYDTPVADVIQATPQSTRMEKTLIGGALTIVIGIIMIMGIPILIFNWVT
jgi:hypothetical protein